MTPGKRATKCSVSLQPADPLREIQEDADSNSSIHLRPELLLGVAYASALPGFRSLPTRHCLLIDFSHFSCESLPKSQRRPARRVRKRVPLKSRIFHVMS